MKQAMCSILERLRLHTPGLSFQVRFWDGDSLVFGNGLPAFTLAFKSERAARRVFMRGVIGFCEEYMARTIDVDGSFQDLMQLGLSSAFSEIKFSLSTRLQNAWLQLVSRDTLKRSPSNIAQHYDRGNSFFSLWLDKSMTYSCAYFRHDCDTLEQAQEQKHEHVCRKLMLKQGEERVL